MKVIYTDVLVIGAGLAGLRMAVGAKRRGHDSIILSLVPPNVPTPKPLRAVCRLLWPM